MPSRRAWRRKAERTPIVGIVYVVAAVLLWSAVPLLIKQAAPPFDVRWVALLRLSMGAGFLAVAQFLVAGRAPTPRLPSPRWSLAERAWLALGGASISGTYLLYTFGVTHTTATAANLIVQVEILALATWGLLILKESLTRAKVAGMALCFGGVFLVAWNGESLASLIRSEHFAGNLIVAAAGLSWSFYGLSQKVLLRSRGVGQTVLPIMTIAAAIAVAAAAFTPPVSRAPTVLEWLYVGTLGFVCTGTAYLLFARGMRVMDASAVALVASLLPVFTMTEAHFILGEELTGIILAGAALVVGGVAMMVVTGRARRGAWSRAPVSDFETQGEDEAISAE